MWLAGYILTRFHHISQAISEMVAYMSPLCQAGYSLTRSPYTVDYTYSTVPPKPALKL